MAWEICSLLLYTSRGPTVILMQEEPKRAVLNMITDPQGIQTSFSYEGNFGAFRDTSKDRTHRDYLHPVGGLRIGKIETYDPHTRKRIRKHYEYGLTETKDPNFDQSGVVELSNIL